MKCTSGAHVSLLSDSQDIRGACESHHMHERYHVQHAGHHLPRVTDAGSARQPEK